MGVDEPAGSETDGPSIPDADTEAIRRAITMLSAEQQQVIFLRLYQALSHEAVAEKLGMSPTAIQQIQYRALVRLRQILLDEPRDGETNPD